MAYDVERIRTEVFHTMREYSNGGEVADGDSVIDYKVSIVPLINKHQIPIARDTKCLMRKYHIAHNMPDNQLGDWFEKETHTATDLTHEALGSQSYSFQVAGTATIYIEEETSDDVWTVLDTITNTPTGIGYTSYRGLTDVVDTDNNVRIRFSGDYYYQYRWVALFAENYPTDDDVPNYQTYVPYTMPDDFMDLNFVEWTHEFQLKENYSAYNFDNDDRDETLYINWYAQGEFIVSYYALPTLITIPPITNPTLYDAVEIDLPDKACRALINIIASDLLRNENPYMSDTFLIRSNQDINNLESKQKSNRGSRSTTDLYGW